MYLPFLSFFRSAVDLPYRKKFGKYAFVFLDSPYKRNSVSIFFKYLPFLFLLARLRLALQKASFGKYTFFRTYLFLSSSIRPTKREFGKYFLCTYLFFFQSIISIRTTKDKFSEYFFVLTFFFFMLVFLIRPINTSLIIILTFF